MGILHPARSSRVGAVILKDGFVGKLFVKTPLPSVEYSLISHEIFDTIKNPTNVPNYPVHGRNHIHGLDRDHVASLIQRFS
jgi:hypothetical protein